MPIFCFDVNFAYDEKLVPITRRNSASRGPNKNMITLEQAAVGPENGPLWELEAEILIARRGCLLREVPNLHVNLKRGV